VTEQREIDLGTPGGSARREYERRRSRREATTRERHPRIGGLLLRLQAAPRSEASWETGAVGEEGLAAHLARRCPEAIVLHDRAMPNSRANIDHLAISPSGVYVIDAKRLRGKIEVRKPFRGESELIVAGRKRTKLVEGLERQRDAVQAALAPTIPEMPVHACLCFLNPARQSGGSGIPLLRTLEINGFPLYYPRKLSKRLNAPGALTLASRNEVAELLALTFPRA
jgi:hypothetical protein